MSNLQNPVNVCTRRITTTDDMVTIDYPVVKNLKSSVAQHNINRAIITLVNQIVKDQGYYKKHNTEMLGWYELKNNQKGILSMTIGNYAYTRPEAHGMTIVKGLTFDVNTGDSYKLSELFKQNSDYVKALSDIAAQQIKERNIQLLDEFKGISTDQDFYIADMTLVLVFQLYEITPYYLGIQYFPIPIYQIQDIIDEEGPLGIMANGS